MAWGEETQLPENRVLVLGELCLRQEVRKRRPAMLCEPTGFPSPEHGSGQRS